jgi:hypothetical protein
MNMSSGSPKIQRNPKVVSHELADGDSVLLHLETGSYHGLNGTGSLIWELIDGERTQEELCTEARRRLSGPPPDLDAVVAAFLADLRGRNLVFA